MLKALGFQKEDKIKMSQVKTLYKASLQMNQFLDTEVPRIRARDSTAQV